MPRESTIQIYRSTTASNTPSLTAGEIAVNIPDRKLFVGGTAGNIVFLDQSSVVTSVNSLTGAVTNVAVTNAAQSFSGVQTFTTGLSAAGATFAGMVSVADFLARTVGGDEGGELKLGLAVTNTTLTGTTVTIDVYQNRLRIFESGGTNRGYYMDLSAASGGVGSQLATSTPYSPPLASASVTGVASFGNEFVVSAAGAVSLTANYVKSVNGLTGAVVSIATTGANTFTGLQTMNAGATANNLYVSRGATFNHVVDFNGATAYFNAASPKITGLNSVGQIRISAYGTGYASPNEPAIIITDGDFDFGGGGAITLNPSTQFGAIGTVTIGGNNPSNANYLNGNTSLSGSNVNIGSLAVTKGLSAQSLTIVTGATFSSSASVAGNLTANSLYVTNGVTFAGTSVHTGLGTFNGGITSSHLYVTNGVTFASRIQGVGATFTGTVEVDTGLILPNGQTITSAVTTFNGASGAVTFAVPLASATVTGAASFGNQFVVSAAGAVSLTSNYLSTFNGLTGAITLTSGSNITLTTVGNTITVASTASGGGGITTTAENTFTALQRFSAGISSAGATFGGQVNCQSNTIYQPTLRYYNEPTSSPTISAGTLTLDLSTSQIFTVSLNSNITNLSITNTPATASRGIGFTLIFTADGTLRTVTWGGAIKWAGATAPTLTSTNGKIDVFSFLSTDAGTSWLGFVGGQNY